MALQPWIPALYRYSPISIRPLQWSHGPSAMDTQEEREKHIERLTPSMEPWPFSHGYSVCSRSMFFSIPFLQWSHGPSAMDTWLGLLRPPAIFQPSMEPWPFSHGYLSGPLRAAPGPGPFNGAMALQPWILPQLRTVGGTTYILQWSHGPSAMDTWWSERYPGRRLATFNGAMALQPWIQRNNRDYSPGLPRPRSNFRIRSPFHHPIATLLLAFPSFWSTNLRALPLQSAHHRTSRIQTAAAGPPPCEACQRAFKQPKPPSAWA